MATRNAAYFGDLRTVHIIGDALQRPEFFIKGESGTYESFTGYTFSAILYDAFGTSRATPTVTVATAIPPDATEEVENSQISIFEEAGNLPTKQGDYLLVIKKVEDSSPTNISTVIRVSYKFEQPYYN